MSRILSAAVAYTVLVVIGLTYQAQDRRDADRQEALLAFRPPLLALTWSQCDSCSFSAVTTGTPVYLPHAASSGTHPFCPADQQLVTTTQGTEMCATSLAFPTYYTSQTK